MTPNRRGRPRKADKYGGHVVAAETLIADRLPELIENLFRLAYGIEVQRKDANGVERVYSQPPDRQANEYLINRILGKPTERVEQETDGRVSIEVVYVDAPAPGGDPQAAPLAGGDPAGDGPV